MKISGIQEKITQFNMRGIERVLEGEQIVDAINGKFDGGYMGESYEKIKPSGALVLTPTRVILYFNKMLKMGYYSADIPLDRINNINFNVSILHADIQIHTGNDIVRVEKISKSAGAEEFVKNVKSLMAESKPASTYRISSPDIADQIKKLADLKAQGILTEEEFMAHKKKILNN